MGKTVKSRMLLSVEQAYALDQAAIDIDKLAAGELMARAGLAAFRLLRRLWPRARRVTIVCGPGNNGGDGFVVGSELVEAGLEPVVLQLGDRAQLTTDAGRARERYEHLGGRLVDYEGGALPETDVVVDALLGIGVARELSGKFLEVVEQINRQPAPVLALDIPTGIDANNGSILNTAIRATATISFIGPKSGVVTGPALDCVGDLYNAELGVSARARQAITGSCFLLDAAGLRELCPQRARSAHKGELGRLLVIGGNQGMSGAAILTGDAAMLSGAGLVRVASLAAIHGASAELMLHRLDDDGDASLHALLRASDVVVIGPGLGRDRRSQRVFGHALDQRRPDQRLVIDADGLYWLAQEPLDVTGAVVTPHPGEAARLLAVSVAEVEANRYAAALAIANKFSVICVLKGAGTVITDGHTSLVCDRGHPAMATAGTGDVLAGIIGALLGQGLEAFDAACCAVYLHAAAGEAGATRAGFGLTAGGLLAEVPGQLLKLCGRDCGIPA